MKEFNRDLIKENVTMVTASSDDGKSQNEKMRKQSVSLTIRTRRVGRLELVDSMVGWLE